ncbi:hypothetical protein G9A89_001999 [Geosiphon pyriformis]|nr:hypothetical protein G9A89_001999 [Geosiphon pyriformis]
MLAGSTSWKSSVLRSYLMKAVHRRLLVAVRKRLYNKSYPGVQCLLCGEVKLPNHAFSCALDVGIQEKILAEASASWISLVEVSSLSFSAVLQFLSLCSSDIGLYLVVCKEFIIKDWYAEAVGVFKDKKEAVGIVINYVRCFIKLHHSRIWLVRSKHRVDMERAGLVGDGRLVSGLTQCAVQMLSNGVANSFAVSFGHFISLNTPLFVAMEPVSLSTGGSGSELTGLGTPVTGGVVDLSAGPLSAALLYLGDEEYKVSWGSEVKNNKSSISGVLDVKNMTNTIAKETSYAESGEDNEMNKTMPRKTWTRTYMLGKPPKAPTFDSMSDDENALSLPSLKCLMAPIRCCLSSYMLWKSEASNHDKLISIKKFFYKIDGFGGVSTPSKFPGVICLTFTSESSLIKARKMAVHKKIVVNGDLKKANIHLNWEVVIKEIPVDLPKVAVESVFSKFGKIVSTRMQLISLWQKARIEFESSEVASLVTSKWSVLVGKDSVCIVLAVSDKQMWGVSLYWTSLVLASCAKCKQFGHIIVNYSVGGSSGICGKKAQVASGTPSHVFYSGFFGSGLRSGLVPPSAVSNSLVVSHLGDHLAVLECSLELLADCVSGILVRLDSFGMVSSVLSSLAFSSVVSAALGSGVDLDMIVDNASGFLDITSPVTDDTVVNLSASSSKVLTAKVGSLETKLVALEALVDSVLDKLNFLCSGLGLLTPTIATCNVRDMNNCAKQADIVCWHKDINNLVSIIADRFDGVHVFTSGLDSGHMGSGVAIILNSLLARHVCKILKMPGQLLLAGDINSFIAKAVNESFFFIFGGDFNENGSHKCASFKKCFDLDLVNSLSRSLFVKSLTWCNSCGVAKMIDYVFVFSNLINTVVDCSVAGINNFFDTDYRAVSVSDIVHKIMILSADGTFKRKWFKSFDGIFIKMSFRFHKLELLVSKLIKTLRLVSSEEFVALLEVWHRLNSPGTSVVKSLFFLGSGFDLICSVLAKAKKFYRASKLLESKCAEKSSIRQAISKRIESFELDKGHTIKSVLERPFHKVVLDHLVMENELILKPNSVKSKVDEIMEGWTRKRRVVSNISKD